MSQKANLLQAIRDYRSTAQHIGSAKNLLERLSDCEKDVERLPDPVPRGGGDVPPERGGEHPEDGSHGPVGHGTTVEVHQHNGPPQFPDKGMMAGLLKRRS